jgi:hypothetical protein
MKTYYVYELINLLGTVEYVGESHKPKYRFRQHIKKKPFGKDGKKHSGLGKFYGRQDIIMNIVKEFSDRKDAWEFQCELQKVYGLLTDRQKLSFNASK